MSSLKSRETIIGGKSFAKPKKKLTGGQISRPHDRTAEYILVHTGSRELDGHPLGGGGSGFGLVPGYTTLLVRVRTNI